METWKFDVQVHLFRGTPLSKVLEAMERKGIDAIALLYYKWEPETFSSISELGTETMKDYQMIRPEKNILMFKSKKTGKVLWVILGQEVATADEEWHILSIGATNVKSGSLSSTIGGIKGRGGIPIIDHPFADPKRRYRDITPDKEEELEKTCQLFEGMVALEWNAYCVPWIRKLLPGGYDDCNAKTERLGSKLGFPVIPTSDLHVNNAWSAGKVGTSFIEIPEDKLHPQELIDSLKENIFSFGFESQKKYVPSVFFSINYGFPLILR